MTQHHQPHPDAYRHHGNVADRWRSHAITALVGVAFAAVTACSLPDTATETAPTTSVDTSTTAAPATTGAPTSTAPPSTTSPPPPDEPARPTAHVDAEIVVDGASIHLRCEGSGSATVVLVSGFEGDQAAWGQVFPAVADSTRVCAYDQPGTGTSSPAIGVATFATQASLLHDLLAAAGEPGPYVLVGHSFGGPRAVEFVDRFREEVAALVLVDASPVGWAGALCSVAADGTEAAAFIHSMCDGWADPNGNVEHLDVFAAFAQLPDSASFGSLPVEVLTAVSRELPPDIAPAERTRLTSTWDQGQQRWAGLSTDSHLVTVDDTSHHIEIDQPAVVIAAIERAIP